MSFLSKEDNQTLEAKLREYLSGLPALEKAAEAGRTSEVKMLLRNATTLELNATHTSYVMDGYAGETALMLAVGNGHLEVVRALLERSDLNVNMRSVIGQNAAEIAVFRRHVEMLQLLCQRDDLTFNVDANGDSLLHLLADRGDDDDDIDRSADGIDNDPKDLDREMCRLLLATTPSHLNTRNKAGFTPLHLAIKHCHLAMCDEIINFSNFDPCLLMERDSQNRRLCSALQALYKDHHQLVPGIVLRALGKSIPEAHFSGACAFCGNQPPRGSRFCNMCGAAAAADGDPGVVQFLGAVVSNETITCDSSGEFDAVMKLRSAMAAAGFQHNAVKQEEGEQMQEKLEYLGVPELHVDDIMFSQDSIAEFFRTGQPLQSLIEDLVHGRADLMHDSRLCIQVMEWPGKGFVSLDNRRMYCFKVFQNGYADGIVRVKARVWRLHSPGW